MASFTFNTLGTQFDYLFYDLINSISSLNTNDESFFMIENFFSATTVTRKVVLENFAHRYQGCLKSLRVG